MTGHTPWSKIKHRKDNAMLPTDAKERKKIPVYSGFVCYFPDAIAEVAKHSQESNAQHNGPDAPLHWDRAKSTDERDALMRHVLDGVDTITTDDAILHARAVAWRAMSELQKLCEERGRRITDPKRVYQNPDFKNSESQKIAESFVDGVIAREEKDKYTARLNAGYDV